MAKVARFDDIRKDIETVVQARDYRISLYKLVLVLPYEMLIATEEKLIGMTSDFEAEHIQIERSFIVGQDSLYGFQTRYDPDTAIRLETKAD